MRGLGLEQEFGEKMKKYKEDKDKAMTEAILGYLKRGYPDRKEEFGMMYKKIGEFLQK